MAENDQTKSTGEQRITERERFRYIGFEVFPGKPKDLFKGDADRDKYVEGVRAKRAKGEILREDCTLLEERVSGLERVVLTLASLLIVGALFLPWFSVYNEIVEEPVAVEEVVAAPAEAAIDETGAVVTEDDAILEEEIDPLAEGEEVVDGGDGAAGEASNVTGEGLAGNEEVIYAGVSHEEVVREYEHVSGIGAIAGMGSFAGHVFGGGIGLLLVGILLLVYLLSCLAIPGYTLYNVYGLKGDADAVALKLKKALKISWLPLALLFVMLIASFLGGSYDSSVTEQFSSLGDSFGPVAFLGTISWGIFVSLVGFILIALKGVEI